MKKGRENLTFDALMKYNLLMSKDTTFKQRCYSNEESHNSRNISLYETRNERIIAPSAKIKIKISNRSSI